MTCKNLHTSEDKERQQGTMHILHDFMVNNPIAVEKEETIQSKGFQEKMFNTAF